MKLFSLSVLSILFATRSFADIVTANNFSTLPADKKAAATDVRLNGKLTVTGNSDFRQLRDLAWQLSALDLSQSVCPSIPRNAMHSRHRLQRLFLPADLKQVGSCAFFACDSLGGKLSFPSSLKEIGSMAFSGCKSLKELEFASYFKIGSFAFRGCNDLKKISIVSPIPPALEEGAFFGVDCSKCLLIVSKGTAKAYKQHPQWSKFKIKESKVYSDEPKPTIVYETKEMKSEEPGLIPIPREINLSEGVYKWKETKNITAAASLANEVAYAKEMFFQHFGIKLGSGKEETRRSLILRLNTSLQGNESYRLIIGESIEIEGSTAEAVFRGLTTLEQLIIGNGDYPVAETVKKLSISDSPRTKIRELMVDPARDFIPFEDLKSLIPEMARYKFNSMHLHLSDDQAWRIEIKAYPLLTQLGSKRVGMDDMLRPIEGFYTQEQMRELVDYASKYHIMIVPEIEMPGHNVAAIHCYPQLSCTGEQIGIRTTSGVSNELLCPSKEAVYSFLGTVFTEMSTIFPSPYFHLGGDEAGNPALGCWTDCQSCKTMRKEKGFTENWQLQEYMFARAIDTLQSLGKTPMFWYETDFKKIPGGCVTFAWRHGLTQTAIKAAIDNNASIMLCPGEHCYIDYPEERGDMPEVNWGMPITSLEQTYRLDPAWGNNEEFEKQNLFGVAGTLWSESINSPERISYMAYPRALALAEAGWSTQKSRSWSGFISRLRPVLRSMQRRGVPFRFPKEYIEQH